MAVRRECLVRSPLAVRQEWDREMQEMANDQKLTCWETLMYASLRPDVVGGPDYERWQTATKLIRSRDLTAAEVLSAAIEFSRQRRLVASIYGLARYFRELRPQRSEAVRAACLVITAMNDSQLLRSAKTDVTNCRLYLALQDGFVQLLLQLLRTSKVDHALLAERMQSLESMLGQRGVHGHALALKWLERQLEHLPHEGWLVEVGCSREIIEGQHSTAQLATFAQQHGLNFAGIDLDPENIDALQRELGDKGRQWILGKGEEVLARWTESIAALYLDAYDFWHPSHSEIREKVYRTAYGAEINDGACHRMHLEATRAGSTRLMGGGILVIDDTWRKRGNGRGRAPWRRHGCLSRAGRCWRRPTGRWFSLSLRIVITVVIDQ